MSLKQIRQRLGWAKAQEANAHEAIDAAFAHVDQALVEIESMLAGAEPIPEPDPAPEPEPAPSGVITRHTFTERLEDGWTESQPPSGWYTIGNDGETYGQAQYSPLLAPGSGPIQVRRGFSAVDELNIGIVWWLSPNFDHNTGSTNKKIYFLEASGTHPIVLGTKGAGYFYLATQRTAEPGDGARQLEGGHWEPGQTYNVRLYIKLNSVDASGNSNPDGIGSVFVDGVRVIHATDFRFRGNDSPVGGTTFQPYDGVDGIRWNPTWPGGGDPPAENMYERLYDVTVSAPL